MDITIKQIFENHPDFCISYISSNSKDLPPLVPVTDHNDVDARRDMHGVGLDSVFCTPNQPGQK